MKTTIVTAEQLNDFDPERYEAHLNTDGTYTLVPLMWWDDASYARYQGDPLGAEPPADASDEAEIPHDATPIAPPPSDDLPF